MRHDGPIIEKRACVEGLFMFLSEGKRVGIGRRRRSLRMLGRRYNHSETPLEIIRAGRIAGMVRI